VKRAIAMVMIILLVISASALACDCYCGCYTCVCDSNYEDQMTATTLVVSYPNWNYEAELNVRAYPDFNSEDLDTAKGGTKLNIIGDFIYTEDERIWCPIWWDDCLAFVSMKYLQPLKDEGSYFFLKEDTWVLREADYDSTPFAKFSGEQEILVKEIVIKDKKDYFAKVLADGYYGYIPMTALSPIL